MGMRRNTQKKAGLRDKPRASKLAAMPRPQLLLELQVVGPCSLTIDCNGSANSERSSCASSVLDNVCCLVGRAAGRKGVRRSNGCAVLRWGTRQVRCIQWSQRTEGLEDIEGQHSVAQAEPTHGSPERSWAPRSRTKP